MMVQDTLDGAAEKAPYAGVCCEACYNAEKERCTCRCHGAYHGLGRKRFDTQTDPTLTSEQAEPFKAAITDPSCLCGQNIVAEPIHYYPHSAGWTVKPFPAPVWLYIVCPNCGYQMALWKMGVKRLRCETI